MSIGTRVRTRRSAVDDADHRRPVEPTAAERELLRRIEDGSLTEIEVAWSDPFGHAAGKRIPAAQFLERARGSGFAFCEAALGWNTDGTVIDWLRLTNWDGGYPDVSPCLTSRRSGRCRGDPASATSSPISSPTTAARHCWIRGRCCGGCWPDWQALGYTAKVGVEFEFYLLDPTARRSRTTSTPTRWRTPTRSTRSSSDLYETLGAFTRLEGIQTEYGPGQVETNLVYTDALEAADDSARLKYAAKEVARKHGKIASFMPKPFSEHSGSSAHLHISLWRDGSRHSAPMDGNESDVALHAIAGLLEHLPSITLFGAHSVNAYRRFVPDSFAPDTVNWSRDNRSAAVRSLIEATPRPAASNCAPAHRMPTRTGWWPRHWQRWSRDSRRAGGRRWPSGGNLYGSGTPLPESLGVASHWPPRTTPSPTSSARRRYWTSRRSRAASGSSTTATSATGNASAIWPDQ